MPYKENMRQHLSRNNEQRRGAGRHCQEPQKALPFGLQPERQNPAEVRNAG